MAEFPPLPIAEWEPIPPGHELRWVPSGIEWQTVPPEDSRSCRWTVGPAHTMCRRPSVARLDRAFWKYRGDKPNWWHYCEDHLYGRCIVDGVIYNPALREVTEPLEHVATITPIRPSSSDELRAGE